MTVIGVLWGTIGHSMPGDAITCFSTFPVPSELGATSKAPKRSLKNLGVLPTGVFSKSSLYEDGKPEFSGIVVTSLPFC